MRIQNSLRNMITAVMQIVVTIILRFIAQSYFIHILGLKYQGLNGLFSSIIGMLGIAELGLGTAILFNMYEYIAKRDIETIKSLLKFYHLREARKKINQFFHLEKICSNQHHFRLFQIFFYFPQSNL